MQTRIDELEIRVAFQDDLLATLNDQVHALHREVATLRGELLALRDRIDGLKAGAGHDPAAEPPPPHY